MVKRTVNVDPELISALVELIRNYPEPSIRGCFDESGKLITTPMEFTNRFHMDLRTYERNQEIVRAVLDANNSFFRTDDIPEEDKVIGKVFLTVELDCYVEFLIKKGLQLQSDFLDEVLRGGKPRR